MKVHFKKDSHPHGTLCGLFSDIIVSDPRLVTCGRCFKKLSKIIVTLNNNEVLK